MENSEYEIPNDENISPADINPEADLYGANLSKADLRGAELSGAKLNQANLSEADLSDANLSEADLSNANLSLGVMVNTDLSEAQLSMADLSKAALVKSDLSESVLNSADLSEAILSQSDFSEASLHLANLSETQLNGTNFSRADLRNAIFSDLYLGQDTQIGEICRQLSTPDQWNKLAQSYHDLKTEFSDQGLDGSARKARYLERQARTKEAWSGETWKERDIMTSIGGFLSRVLTGYGTRASYVLIWTALLLILPALWYAIVPSDGWEGGVIYYSVVTFVTSPPHPPSTTDGIIGILTDGIVLFQTYVGTALIILFGYVLSNRDRI